MPAMTILSVRGTPVRSGRVRKTVRMSTGRCNPHGATQNQRGLHRSRLAPTAQCTCRGSGPSPALWQAHKPDDTPVKVHLPTSEPRNVLVDSLRLLQLVPSRPRPRPYGRVTCQPATARGPSRFAGTMTPTFVSVVVGSESTPTGEGGLSQTSWTERQLVPSGDGR